MRRYWFTFYTSYMPQGNEPGMYRMHAPTVYARTLEHARLVASRRVPEGHRILGHSKTNARLLPWTPDFCCQLCSGPWHPTTGHLNLRKGQMWCGPCTRAAVKFIKDHSKRRWGGIKFYDHAFVPPKNPPPGWEP